MPFYNLVKLVFARQLELKITVDSPMESLLLLIDAQWIGI